MERWLASQAGKDLFQCPDGTGEHLQHGMYHRYHTMESLKRELVYSFDIVDCNYESDPRYVVCVVTKKNNENKTSDCPFQFESDTSEKYDYDVLKTEEVISSIEAVCHVLKTQHENVLEYSRREKFGDPIQEVNAPIADFLEEVETLFTTVN
jgi:hypothetical protein